MLVDLMVSRLKRESEKTNIFVVNACNDPNINAHIYPTRTCMQKRARVICGGLICGIYAPYQKGEVNQSDCWVYDMGM